MPGTDGNPQARLWPTAQWLAVAVLSAPAAVVVSIIAIVIGLVGAGIFDEWTPAWFSSGVLFTLLGGVHLLPIALLWRQGQRTTAHRHLCWTAAALGMAGYAAFWVWFLTDFWPKAMSV